jgi:uncharacterized protein YndB with AHSA1/START domain
MPETLATTQTSFSVSRTLDAPRETVFSAWTEPDALKQWWGPPGYTIPSAEVDLRPGGSYRIGMKPDDGDTFYLMGKFIEVRPPEKLVYTWAWQEDGGPGHESQVTVEFRSSGSDKTEVVITHERLENSDSRDRHVQGWDGCLTKLTDLVPERPIRLDVTIKAPASEVFRALTDDRQLERWWPTAAKSDLRVGGKYFYDFKFDDPSDDMDQDGVFVEIVPDSRLRYTWPATEQDLPTEVGWDVKEQGGSTKLKLTHVGFGYGPTWEASVKGHTHGWTAFLANLKSVMEGGPDTRKSAMGQKTKV